MTRTQKHETKRIDVSSYLLESSLANAETAAQLRERLEWPEHGAVLLARVRVAGDGGVKPIEIVEALTGSRDGVLLARVGVYDVDGDDPIVVTKIPPPKQPSLPRADSAEAVEIASPL